MTRGSDRHSVRLDLTTFNQLVTKGKESVRKLNRASALQLSHQGYKPEQINALLGISVATIYNLRTRYRQEGLLRAIGEKARTGQPRKVTPKVEADITAMACSQAPDGSVRWTAHKSVRDSRPSYGSYAPTYR